ncbi:hypothetical protein SAMN05444817_10628 [Corynebacterium appendicis CIP 107643]|uniref:Uncharacterized protein n=1 Tax=Corynebacterium appendicis CIP 107643 TaxID=1161099 RepID=A0A1N7JDB9_9CORY|nr:hypothetical protein CAPP_03470 [Corynebacterium appendicis CIP 107643]SIS47382.1 hypothetical protein SAMN05444817_10628 [Corynebacterium appendicis CIP 107643]
MDTFPKSRMGLLLVLAASILYLAVAASEEVKITALRLAPVLLFVAGMSVTVNLAARGRTGCSGGRSRGRRFLSGLPFRPVRTGVAGFGEHCAHLPAPEEIPHRAVAASAGASVATAVLGGQHGSGGTSPCFREAGRIAARLSHRIAARLSHLSRGTRTCSQRHSLSVSALYSFSPAAVSASKWAPPPLPR